MSEKIEYIELNFDNLTLNEIVTGVNAVKSNVKNIMKKGFTSKYYTEILRTCDDILNNGIKPSTKLNITSKMLPYLVKQNPNHKLFSLAQLNDI